MSDNDIVVGTYCGETPPEFQPNARICLRLGERHDFRSSGAGFRPTILAALQCFMT